MSYNVTKSNTQIAKTKSINITGDFWTWYNTNKKSLPFYAPPVLLEEPIIEDPSGSEFIDLSQTADVNDGGADARGNRGGRQRQR